MTLRELSEILARELGAEVAERALGVLVSHAAGETLYIPRRARPPDVSPADTPADLQRRYRVSRSTAYSWVSAWRR